MITCFLIRKRLARDPVMRVLVLVVVVVVPVALAVVLVGELGDQGGEEASLAKEWCSL